MAFKCPICKTATIVAGSLEENLPTEMCSTCGGHWITSARYFSYVVTMGAVEAPQAGGVRAKADEPGVKLCPTCLKFMHYYRVGHGLPFGIDKCNTCGGVWLNAGEWEALKARGFLRQVHAITAEVWQEEVARQERARQEIAGMVRRVGEADFAEVQRVVLWLRGH